MYMYEVVAARLGDREATDRDVKSFYRDCHKGPIPYIRGKIVFFIVCYSFTYLSIQFYHT